MIFCRQLHDFLSTRLSNNLFIVIHATVAYLDGIAVEDFSKVVVFRKVFVYQGEESVSDISADVFAKWRVACTRGCSVVCFSVWKSWLARSVECIGIRFRRVLFGMGGAAWSNDVLSDDRDDSIYIYIFFHSYARYSKLCYFFSGHMAPSLAVLLL